MGKIFFKPIDNVYSKEMEQRLIRENKIIKKKVTGLKRVSWLYNPNKIENYLENMESEGFRAFCVFLHKGLLFYNLEKQKY